REERLPHGDDVAGHGGLGGEPLVRGDVLDEPEELGRERLLRKRLRPVAAHTRRHLDDVVVRQARERAVVARVDDVHLAGSAGERRRESDRSLAVERAAPLLEQGRLLGERRVAVHPEQLALDLHYLPRARQVMEIEDRKSTRLNSSHEWISYAVFCLKKKKN